MLEISQSFDQFMSKQFLKASSFALDGQLTLCRLVGWVHQAVAVGNGHLKESEKSILPTAADCLCTFLLPKNYVEVRRHSKRTWVWVRYTRRAGYSERHQLRVHQLRRQDDQGVETPPAPHPGQRRLALVGTMARHDSGERERWAATGRGPLARATTPSLCGNWKGTATLRGHTKAVLCLAELLPPGTCCTGVQRFSRPGSDGLEAGSDDDGRRLVICVWPCWTAMLEQ
ncbi:hypothetical protein PR202_ga17604 [Eleusine coracana subsp. coracana]|uniref:Uncharacterized protein n=1 Tax=Eleusine coracana subsp. coracana TaxID=191504 RepID=A0AAV5CPI4_ELECO|nr:hypothetical protein PR202_ga17357 [Eleusine coracana subsp. coracana]GJN00422.1 hypothetical protein PR202_ga17604 [Eleusine coracana subsp. coracana]